MTTEDEVRAMLNIVTGRISSLPFARSAPSADANTSSFSLRRGALDWGADGPTVAPPAWAISDGVQRFGVGEKETCGRLLNEVALKVYVEKKRPNVEIEVPVPKRLSIGGIDNVVTDVVEIGKIELHGNTQRIRPALPGFSIGRAGDAPSTSTFGMVVRKKDRPNPFFLLNNCHGIAASGSGKPGDVITQPGAMPEPG